MPLVTNKIIINGNRAEGDHQAIKGEYASIQMLGTEAQGMLPLDQLIDLKERLEKTCAAHTLANRLHLDELREVERELRKMVDDELLSKKP